VTISSATVFGSFSGPITAPADVTLVGTFFDAADIEIAEVDDATGVATPLTAASDYTAALAASPPSSITLTVIRDIASGKTWRWRRSSAVVQPTDLSATTKLDMEGLERSLDRLSTQVQDVDATANSSVRVPVEDAGMDMVLPNVEARKGNLLAFDSATGKPTATDPTTLVPGTVNLGSWILSSAILESTSAAQFTQTAGALINFGPVQGSASYEGRIPSGGLLGAFIAPGTHGKVLRSAASIGGTTEVKPVWALPPLDPYYLFGLNVSVPTTTTLTVSAGSAYPSGAASERPDMRLASSLTKSLNTAGNWASGASGNAFPGAALGAVDTWYHVFLLALADGTVDVGCDTSVTASNLLADSGVTTWSSSGTVYYRRIGSVRTATTGATFEPMTQLGPMVFWSVPWEESPASSTSRTLVTMRGLPPDVRTIAWGTIDTTAVAASDSVYVSNPDHADLPPVAPGAAVTRSVNSLATAYADNSTLSGTNNFVQMSDTQQRLGVRRDSTTGVSRINVVGYFDPRGTWGE